MLGVWRYNAEIEMLGTDPGEALVRSAHFTRDKNRTPMQWSGESNAGFSPPLANTWLPVHTNYTLGVNVADQDHDPGSLLNYYRKMLAFRKQTPALIAGTYIPLHPNSEDYLSFLRTHEDQTCLVILNMSPDGQTLSFDLANDGLRPLFSNFDRTDEKISLSNLEIFPYEVFIAELT
jgi:glycosidase